MSDLENPTSFAREDLEAFWMPYTGNRHFKNDPRLIVAAKGTELIDTDGRRVFDGLSGLWCTPYGHGRQEIADAVATQLTRLDYAPPFQFGHPLAFELANRLTALAPDGLETMSGARGVLLASGHSGLSQVPPPSPAGSA